MCGIAGIFNFDSVTPSEKLLKAMGDRMSHRGPDDSGIYANGPVGFAFRRLSILDLSDHGHQPMFDDTGSYGIVYNGECYNFRDLRKELKSRGCVFRSQTDTEVILYGFREFGPQFVNKLSGMFSFAIWDIKKRELYVFRDRMGIKPLYFHKTDNNFIFASEIKPIFEAGVIPELNKSEVNSYFSLRYVPSENSLFKGIKKLQPGTFLKIKADGTTESFTYWSLLDQVDMLPLNESQASEKFFEFFDDAIKQNLVSDVPVGAFLSGGVDSAAIVALMKRHQEKVETFTFGMGSDIDESGRAKEIAQLMRVNNEQIHLQPNDFEHYSKALWHLEEPIGDSIIVPTFLLAKQAAQKVKVVLLGEGADEIMGGYVHQLALTYGQKIKNILPSSLRAMVSRGFAGVPHQWADKIFPYPASLGKRGLGRVFQYLGTNYTFGQSYVDLAGLFSSSELSQLLSPEVYKAGCDFGDPSGLFTRYYEMSKNSDYQNRLMQVDLKYWNTDYGLLRMDKLTMAHSLEARVPYLDHRLVELCLRLPQKFKTKNFKQKRLLRSSLAKHGVLPSQITKTPKKAFYLPIEKCFGKNFDDFLGDHLSDSALKRRGLFNQKVVSQLRDKKDRELIENKQVMAILCFELWAKQYLDLPWSQS